MSVANVRAIDKVFGVELPSETKRQSVMSVANVRAIDKVFGVELPSKPVVSFAHVKAIKRALRV